MRIGEAKNFKELVNACETARKRRLELRRGYETIWWNNIALVAGDHYASWNPHTNTFEDRDPFWDAQTETKKPRMVINHALTVGRTELAKLTKSHPIMEIIANSTENRDIAATRVGRSALDFAEWKFRLKKMRKQALWWMIQTGLCGIYVGYDWEDDAAGEFEFPIDPITKEVTFSEVRRKELEDMVEQGELQSIEMERFPLGELEYKLYSPFQLLPDETCLDFDLIKDLITTDVVDVDVLKGMYDTNRTKSLRPESDAVLGVMEKRMLMRAGVAGNIGGGHDSVDAGVRVHTFWLLPNVYRGNKFLNEGVLLRWCNGEQILEENEGFPFSDNRMPFTFFQHIPTSTTIWPDCVMNHIRGPNLEIDKTVSQLIENKDYMANPMWRIATQHKVKGEVRNVAGAILKYRHVPNIPPPEPIQGLQMPPQVENLLAGLRAQILDISGQSEVARGRVPTGVRSGVAVAYLQEEDDTKLGPTVENMEEAIALMGSLSLSRFGQFYHTERIIRFYRRDGAFDAMKFKGADLKGNTDVIPQSGSAMPRMKAVRQQYTLQLAEMGIMQDPKRIMEELDLGRAEPDVVDKSIAQADRENDMMLYGVRQGQAAATPSADPEMDAAKVPAAIPVKVWHNHSVHLDRHISVMLDEEFDRLAISNPDIVRLFDEHVAMHQAMLQQQQLAQMQMLEAAKGAPDGPPGGQQKASPNGKPSVAGSPEAEAEANAPG